MLSLIAFQNSSPDDDLAQIDVPSRSGPSFSVGKLRNVRIKVDSSVGKLAELPLLLELGGLLSVLENRVKSVYCSPGLRAFRAWFVYIFDHPAGQAGDGKARARWSEKTYVIGVVSHDCGLVECRGKEGFACRWSCLVLGSRRAECSIKDLEVS